MKQVVIRHLQSVFKLICFFLVNCYREIFKKVDQCSVFSYFSHGKLFYVDLNFVGVSALYLIVCLFEDFVT